MSAPIVSVPTFPDTKITAATNAHLSLADLMAWEALPEDVTVLARRVLGYTEVGEASLQDAYEAGWDEAIENATVESYGSSTSAFNRWRKRR